jgi:hypothetical protein
MSKAKGVRPYNYKGNRLAIRDCFYSAQKDVILYLCLLAQFRSIINVIQY